MGFECKKVCAIGSSNECWVFNRGNNSKRNLFLGSLPYILQVVNKWLFNGHFNTKVNNFDRLWREVKILWNYRSNVSIGGSDNTITVNFKNNQQKNSRIVSSRETVTFKAKNLLTLFRLPKSCLFNKIEL
jgi:hypothetical protein